MSPFHSLLNILTYDIDNSEFSSEPINLRILSSLEGISQISVESSLFLCGSSKLDNSHVPTSGAFLLQIANQTLKKVQFLINSKHSHYNPSLCNYANHSLVVIGGKQQTKCEVYNITSSRWKTIQDLPEERYLCSLMVDKNDEYLYLFGGFNRNVSMITGSVLRVNLTNYFTQWERIMINENGQLLKRCSMNTFRSANSNLIYIIGGRDIHNEHEVYDDVIIYDCFCKIVKSSNMKLKKKTKFINYGSVDIHKVQYYFIDQDGDVIMINAKNHNIELSSQGQC